MALTAVILSSLLKVKERLREMEIRRSYTNEEMLGHFCTELRRLPGTANLSMIGKWRAPFEPRSHGWPVSIYHVDETLVLTQVMMVDLCDRAVAMTEDDISILVKLTKLEAQIPSLGSASIEFERLTRKLSDLFTETCTFAHVQETA